MIPLFIEINPEDSAIWLIYKDEEILFIKDRDFPPILTQNEFNQFNLKIKNQFYLGKINNQHCYVAEISDDQDEQLHVEFKSLKLSFELFNEEELYFLCSKAKQVLNWNRTHQFCGRCGKKTDYHATERARYCENCNAFYYPQISPVVMVAITRGSKILLARSPHFTAKLFSVLAGFVEPGESLEQTVHREVMEEVAIKIKNLKYYGSQPWPFPSNLMIGFTAEYDSGEIQIDGIEIEAADWFDFDKLPLLSKRYSLSRQLIDFVVNSSR